MCLLPLFTPELTLISVKHSLTRRAPRRKVCWSLVIHWSGRVTCREISTLWRLYSTGKRRLYTGIWSLVMTESPAGRSQPFICWLYCMCRYGLELQGTPSRSSLVSRWVRIVKHTNQGSLWKERQPGLEPRDRRLHSLVVIGHQCSRSVFDGLLDPY